MKFLHPWNFPRQKSWSGLLFPSPEDLPNPGIEPRTEVILTKSEGGRGQHDCKNSEVRKEFEVPADLERAIEHGEETGNSLQCSCLENPREGGAWWAAIYGVTRSWARLKQLSSGSTENGEDREGKNGREKQFEISSSRELHVLFMT